MKSKQLNLCAPVGKVGYGVAGYNILKGLVEKDWQVALFSRDSDARQEGGERLLIDRCVSQAQKFFYDAPCLKIWHQHELFESVGRGPYIAFPFFELDTFTEVEKHNLQYPTFLFTASNWGKEVIVSECGISTANIEVIPLGIDPLIFNPDIKPKPIVDKFHTVERKENSTVFLNCGKWEIRKGHDLLIDLFHTAFTKEDNVELWMVPHNPFLTSDELKEWEDMYLNTPMGRAGRIRIFDWQENHEDIANIIVNADIGIFPSRAEGWNLELLEMMALGKPVIATNYSAHTEFCNKDNCMLVDVDDVESAYDGKWFFDQGKWADIDANAYNSFVEHMRNSHNQKGKVNEAGIETGRKFTWNNTVDKIENFLLDISP